VATIDGDLEEARKLAIQARKLGQRLDVVSLEMFALAVEGLALVNAGEVADGMRYLDEATAAALAGEFEEIVAAGWTFCFLLKRLRAGPRLRARRRVVPKGRGVSRRMRTNFVTLACRAHYGAVLTWHGRWTEAEKSLTEAQHLALERPSLGLPRDRATRRRQGRFDEAEEFVAGYGLPRCQQYDGSAATEVSLAGPRHLPGHQRARPGNR
jgi:ATP/maltotriose-dependent transcriptional regulator MalT